MVKLVSVHYIFEFLGQILSGGNEYALFLNIVPIWHDFFVFKREIFWFKKIVGLLLWVIERSTVLADLN